MEYRRRRGLEFVLGVLMAFAGLAAIALIWNSFSGRFSSDVKVDANLSKAGDALEVGDIVTYRDVIVGNVVEASGIVSGGARLRMTIHAAQAKVIPDNVTAVALPESLFGPTKIQLVAPHSPSAGHLHDGSLISADTNPSTESLQTALANAYDLLTAVHPADLDAALTALATSLRGQGKNLGTLIEQSATYLRSFAPHLPELDDTINSLATVSQELAKNSPAFLTTLSNSLVVAKAILANKQAVAQLLDVAPGAVNDAALLLNPRNVDNAVTVFTNEVPVLAALAADPSAIVRTISGFRAFADTFSKTIKNGAVRGNVLATGANFAVLFNAAIGQNGTAFDAIKNPPLYTSANCPRYAGMNGPNCGEATRDESYRELSVSTGSDWGGRLGSTGSPAEVATVGAAASAITGIPISEVPDMTDLLLGPFLRGSATVIE